MGKRRQRGPTQQRKVTLSSLVWELLELYAERQTAAYAKIGGKTGYTISDALEEGAGVLLRDVHDDVGPMPGKDASKAEIAAYVDRLASVNKKRLLAELLQAPPRTDS